MQRKRNMLIKSGLALNFIACFLAVLMTGYGGAAYADKVGKLYEARVPVSSQDRDERNEAIRVAFAEVLVRVSGRTNIAESEGYTAINEAIERATRYAQQFRFYKANPPPRDPEAPKLVLWVRFDEQAVNQVLRNNQLPVWGDTRPATLVWLVIDNRGHRELVGNDLSNKNHRALQKQASRRGVPLRFPLLDLADRSNLRASDVWGNFESTILRASQRYQTEAVLVGRVYQGYSSYWNARWSLYTDGRRQDWTVSGSNIDEVLAAGIDKTAESLALRYAQVGLVGEGHVLVQVKDIKNLADYNRVSKYLRSLSHVSAVNPYQVEDKGATFQLITPGGRLGVARAVSLGHTLITEPVTSVPVAGTAENPEQNNHRKFAITIPDLIYRLVP